MAAPNGNRDMATAALARHAPRLATAAAAPGSAWVTGARGFVGSHLVAALRHAGWCVKTVRIRMGKPPASVPAIPATPSSPARGDVVFHLSGIAHRAATAAEHMAANCELALRLYQSACRAEARAFVFVSTSKVLGDGNSMALDADAPRRPRGPYAASKAAAEERLLAARQRANVPLAIVRPPLVYGPGVQGNLRQLLVALAKGLPLPLGLAQKPRSFVSVRNLVSALAALGGAPNRSDGIWHVADGEDVDCAALCRMIGGHLGRPARLLPVPPAACALALRLLPSYRAHAASLVASAFEPLQLDASAFRRAFGWSPPQTLDDGLAELAAWYRGDAG